ncbi:pyridoxal phosphate-dependent aminotransferase [Elongatibacter sediminis]|uniref:Pyridoxal phosphate-dependent aminotransferase n=1 Tax=Elongatibacter sediminis TaxID=3119006 RepID=A0AAW9RFB0_9GAMM
MITSKLPRAGTTIFTVMSRLADDHGAINLSQGFPDFDGPQALRDRVGWHVENGHNQYAPLAGLPALREAIADKAASLYGRETDPETEVVVTPGATEALYCAITAVVRPGDEVIVFDPAYDTYAPSVELNGGRTRHIALRHPDYRIDWEEVRAAITPETRMIVLNTPHNPSGTTWSEADIEGLRRAVDGTDILLLSDEVYEHILFDGRQHVSLLRYPDLSRRAFCVFSFGKTYHATGWRVGYCIAPRELTDEFLKIHQYINFSTNTPMQFALADYLAATPEFHLGLGAFYQEKRDEFCDLLSASRFGIEPAAGTYFQLADYSSISDEPDTDFARRLTIEHGVGAIPVSVFYRDPPGQKVVRFCFAKDGETLQAAARRLATL